MADNKPHKAKGSKKNRKFLRNKQKCEAYRKAQKREKNKLKRILRSNGKSAAIAYAEQHGLKLL